MPPKCRKTSKHAALVDAHGHRRRRVVDRDTYYHRRRTADILWRAEMTSCFNALRCLVLPSSPRSRLHRSRRAVLQAAVQRLRYLEGVVSELLANDNGRRATPRNLRDVRSQFRRSLEATPPARRKRRQSEQSSPELLPSLEVLGDCDQEAFTGVRELGGASNRADAAMSVPSSPSICQVWWSNRAVEEAIMSSPTVQNLVDSFYDDVPLPTNGLNSAQLVPDEVIVLEAVPPSDSDDEQLVPFATLASDFDSSNFAGDSKAIRSEDPLLSSAIVHTAKSPEKHLLLCDEHDAPNWPAEQLIIGTQVDWVLDIHL
ncbi:uncharacterized protein LOC142576063 [Dermacentor variabilis]|uniref:uncharacterized protein LOC142576063 n=1 Tax=Dermacentor variabilis TaxID=34621 RepID=UPI003F5C9339